MQTFSILLQTTISLGAFALPDSQVSSDYGALNFKANFGNAPQPMTVDVSPKFVATTRTKASLTRPAIDLEEDPWSEGVPAANITYIADYWANNYEWFDIQKQLNENFKHFTTTVGPLSLPNSTFKDPIPLHFVHHRSSRTDAIPLLFIHGWPGSFLEVERILPGLLNPPSPSDPAFHVVAPSIPGFGFSPAPRRSGFGLIETGAAFNELMHQLGYGRYVVQGGDFGSHTSRYMGAMFPESVVSILANLWGAHPNASDLERFQQNLTSPEEASFIKSDEASAPFVEAFWGIQRAVPLQIGMLLGDSPVGNVAWPYLGMVGMTPGYNWPVEEIITWAMMLYIQGPYGSVRIYKELGREGTLDYAFPYVSIPVGILQYYGDAGYGAPREWCERTGNITYFSRKNNSVGGGHFPSTANPDDLVAEIRKFWGSPRGGWAA